MIRKMWLVVSWKLGSIQCFGTEKYNGTSNVWLTQTACLLCNFCSIFVIVWHSVIPSISKDRCHAGSGKRMEQCCFSYPCCYYKFSVGDLWDSFTEPEGEHQWCINGVKPAAGAGTLLALFLLPVLSLVPGLNHGSLTGRCQVLCWALPQSVELEHLALSSGSAALQLCLSDFHFPKAVFSYVTITQKLCYYIYCYFHIIFIFLINVLCSRDYFIHLKVKDTAYAPRGTTNN